MSGTSATVGNTGSSASSSGAAASAAGAFVHTSPIASSTHDPLLSLSSNCVRNAFGPTVQLVADALHSRGASTLPQLLAYLKQKCSRAGGSGSDRKSRNNDNDGSTDNNSNHQRLGVIYYGLQSQQREDAYEPSSVRAALLVLIQHGIVTFQRSNSSNNNTALTSLAKAAATAAATSRSLPPGQNYVYSYHPEQARNLMRYAKYVEFLKKAQDETAAAVVQTLLLRGRLLTMDWLVLCVQELKTSNTNHNQSADAAHHRYTLRQQVVEAVYKLVTQGFVQKVKTTDEQEQEEEEHEFEGGDVNDAVVCVVKAEPADPDAEPPAPKRVRLQEPENTSSSGIKTAADVAPTITTSTSTTTEDPALLSLLQGSAHYKSTLPIDALWRVNLPLFHEYFQAFHLGRLVAERYGSKVQSCGSLVTAALRYMAQQRHNINHIHNHNTVTIAGQQQQPPPPYPTSSSTFEPSDMSKYLPKPVLQLFEKKVGGLQHNLQKAWDDLVAVTSSSAVGSPSVVRRCSGSSSAVYEICVRRLLDYLQQRVQYQVIHDRYSPHAGGLHHARIVRILTIHGWLEAETIADFAMVPVKDTREILHALYRHRYVELLQLSASSRQQYNPANAIYLWGVYPDRFKRKITENVATSLLNIRLRRQHQVQVLGKDWIERAQLKRDASDQHHHVHHADENDHEMDRRNYQKFCLGLERLDFAAMQLDETLLVLQDFQVGSTW